MTEIISKSYWFSSIKAKATVHIRNCLKCIAYSDKNGKEEGLLHNIPKGSLPFEIVHIDHYGPVGTGRSKKHILVVIDAFTKFVRLYATKTTNTKEVIGCLKDYFRAYSRPTTIVSDRGSCFTSNEQQKGKVIDELKENLIELRGKAKDRNLPKIRKTAKKHQTRAQTYNKKYTDIKRRVAREYQIGEYVMIKNFDSTAGVSRKLVPKFKGVAAPEAFLII